MSKFNLMEFLKRPGKDVQVCGLVMSVGQHDVTQAERDKAKEKGWSEPKDQLYLLVNANDLGEIKVKADPNDWKPRELQEYVGAFVEIPVEHSFGQMNNKPWESFKVSGVPEVLAYADGREVGA